MTLSESSDSGLGRPAGRGDRSRQHGSLRPSAAYQACLRRANARDAPQLQLDTRQPKGGDCMASQTRNRNSRREEQRNEDPPGFGTLFDRRKTRTNPKAPDFSTGETLIVLEDGTELEAAVWLRKREGKQPTIRIHIQAPYQREDDVNDEPDETDDDELPF